ncbi:hypothetical protein [uncultured Psychroserpens sp.]|uniref:hypothetical protein n=1 Tax=uncultured Psychroserpens sp. TaxID=255436 RepID=UPI00260E0EB6|nr:hypothetical protein [uncultured Psychroserpens sp.]
MEAIELYLVDVRDNFNDKDVLNEIISVILDNPFIEVEVADYELKYSYNDSINKEDLCKQLSRKKQTSFRLFSKPDSKEYISVVKTKHKNVIHFHLNKNESLNLLNNELNSYILRLANSLPQFHTATIKLIKGNEIGDFYYENEITKVPSKSFGGMYVEFMHFIAPSLYLDEYGKKDLLAAPAVMVKECENDIIQIQGYSDSNTPKSKRTVEELKRLTPYLRSKAKWNN